jgi:hypothetical protein
MAFHRVVWLLLHKILGPPLRFVEPEEERRSTPDQFSPGLYPCPSPPARPSFNNSNIDTADSASNNNTPKLHSTTEEDKGRRRMSTSQLATAFNRFDELTMSKDSVGKNNVVNNNNNATTYFDEGLSAVRVSPRVMEELSREEIMKVMEQVLSFSFPATSEPELSIFSGYIFLGGKQLAWTRHMTPRGLSQFTISLREEKDQLLATAETTFGSDKPPLF